MDRRDQIAAMVTRWGIKLDEDDPAFLLVDLNLMVLDDKTSEAAKRLEFVTEKFNTVATRNVDDFVSVANEALSKFIQRTNEIKTTLDAMNIAKPAAIEQPLAPAAATVAKPTKPTQQPRGYAGWSVSVAFIVGVSIGATLAAIVLR